MSSLPSSYLKLTRQQRLYVDSRLQGLTQVASAAAAGAANPKKAGNQMEKSKSVQAALVSMMERTAEEVNFGRKEAHDMYMDAYQNAETAAEQIAAVTAMVKLHGLEAPKKVEVEHNHSHSGELRFMPTEDLVKLAGMEEELALEGEFQEIGEAPMLQPPEITDENTLDQENVRETSGYD